MDFSCASSTPANVSAEVPVTLGGEDDDLGASADAATDAATENGWRDSGIAMDTDAPPPTNADAKDGDAEEETVVGRAGDHGCVDFVREHGQLVQRMRWESSEFPGGGSGAEDTPSAMP